MRRLMDELINNAIYLHALATLAYLCIFTPFCIRFFLKVIIDKPNSHEKNRTNRHLKIKKVFFFIYFFLIFSQSLTGFVKVKVLCFLCFVQVAAVAILSSIYLSIFHETGGKEQDIINFSCK